MKFRRSLVSAGAVSALALVAAGPALAGTNVSVRVEGLTKTLLPATTITVPGSGSITQGGAPAGKCPADSGAGALNTATHGMWKGSYSSYGIEVNSILGNRYRYSSGDYWSIFVNGHYATKGICDLKLTAREQLLFAPYPSKGKTYPIELTAPRTAAVNTPIQVKAYYYPGAGSATKPIKGVRFSGATGTTNAQGIATITPDQPGPLRIVGSAKGYIRSAQDTIQVHN